VSVEIRRAIPEDAAGICEAHRRAILELCSGHYSLVELDAWAGRLTPDAHLPVITSREMFVAFDGSILV
jgi:hypothetical protein